MTIRQIDFLKKTKSVQNKLDFFMNLIILFLMYQKTPYVNLKISTADLEMIFARHKIVKINRLTYTLKPI